MHDLLDPRKPMLAEHSRLQDHVAGFGRMQVDQMQSNAVCRKSFDQRRHILWDAGLASCRIEIPQAG